jgi:hypothetical protein
LPGSVELRNRFESLGVAERQAELRCRHQGDECALHKRPADDFRIVLRNPRGDFAREAADGLGVEAQQFEIEPQIPMMPRF